MALDGWCGYGADRGLPSCWTVQRAALSEGGRPIGRCAGAGGLRAHLEEQEVTARRAEVHEASLATRGRPSKPSRLQGWGCRRLGGVNQRRKGGSHGTSTVSAAQAARLSAVTLSETFRARPLASSSFPSPFPSSSFLLFYRKFFNPKRNTEYRLGLYTEHNL